MSANVVPLARKEDSEEQWRQGPAVCLGCKHEWVLVSQVNGQTDGFKCPSCDMDKGAIRGLHIYRSEDHFECKCGSLLFSMTRQRVYCPNCGLNHKPWD